GRPILEVLVPIGMMEILRSGKSEYAQKFKVGRRTFIMNRDPVLQEGQIIGAVGVFQDVSEIEWISEELASVRELNRELNSIIQSSADGFFITDTTGTILRVNKAFEEMSQSSAQELIGKKMQQFVDQGLFSHYLADLVLQRKRAVTVMETKQDMSLLITGSPVWDEQGEIVRVVINLRNMTSLNQLRQELMDAKRLSQQYHLELAELRKRQESGIIGFSREMERVLELAGRVAKVDSTVLLRGESGVGKEMIAQMLHAQSARVDGPFIKLNCGAIPEALLESELFGYAAGAFTGARRDGKPGMFELAHTGTIFLDEVGDLPPSLQAKLLRVLQDREFVPVGGVSPRRVDVRILAATHKDLESMVKAGEFREDLFFRLNVVPIWIPPLRERGKDIIDLLYHFRDKFSKKYGIMREFAPEVIEAFLNYDWPGNVRELENMVERLMVVTQGEQILPSHLPAHMKQAKQEGYGIEVHALMPLKDAVNLVEEQLVKQAMEEYGSTYKAAQVLGVNQSTVVRRMAKFSRLSVKIGS
ncbi:MAG TPA: sigma 54-interacting transcriptional regulator, partial [Verrucomicrobiae bacterium]|nr:sigma 54-interacting transcriptional regulator [Verrucomicrobiae bacterium]